MKNKLFVFFAFIFAFAGLIYSDVALSQVKAQGDIQVIQDNEFDANYLDTYSVPTNMFNFSTDGGHSENLEKVFDRNYNTHWESETVLVNGETVSLTLDFTKQVTVDRIIFGNEPYSVTGTHDGALRGFPTQFKIYYKTTGDWVELQYYEHESTNSLILISFDTTTLNSLKFEYIKVDTHNRYTATCREFIVLQPQSDDLEKIRNMFTDYNQYTLNEDVNSFDDINQLRESAKNYVNIEKLEEILTRAEQIISKTLTFDARREMSTNPTAENVIYRHGDIYDYARNVLKMSWYGTNRQATGIVATPGEQLVVYVTGNSTDKLPKLRYSQFWGHWKNWLSAEYELKLGKNVITIEKLIAEDENYTLFDSFAGQVVLGGPVYLVNPYTDKDQSSNVKVYFEGGTLFPVFRLDDDESKYKLLLNDYTNYVENNPTSAINVTELVSENFIMTIRATSANTVYKTKSPQQNLLNWDAYMKEVLAFDGVQFEVGEPHYDERSQYLNCNIRLMQPTGEAYAHVEHVGIQPSWEEKAIYADSWGWGYTHELGHMMDMGERIVSECSNNMMSKYNETAMEQVATRGEFDATIKALTPYDYQENFFEQFQRLNYLIWWLIESYDIGFWAKLENLYRYEQNDEIRQLQATEKQIYLASLATQMDLRYYFERFGYSLSKTENDPIFKSANASTTFNNLMSTAIARNKIKNDKQLKFWYLDSKEYLFKKQGNTACYTLSDTPSIDYVVKSGSGYHMRFTSSKSNLQQHLGYEILEGSGNDYKVIGFTYSNAFTDTRTYDDNYVPSYKVVAYDRDLNTSNYSLPKSDTSVANSVCKLNGVNYNSLSQAVSMANDDDIIYLLQDCKDGNMKINKNITITLDENVSSDITIKLVGDSEMFFVDAGKKLTISGTQEHKIIIDGDNYIHNGALIGCYGSLTLNYVTLKNNISKSNGGGLNMMKKNETTIYENMLLQNVEFINCYGVKGGGAYIGSGFLTVAMNNCTFDGCKAVNGGAVYVEGGTVVRINDSIITNNIADYGGVVGGDSYIEFNNCQISGNSANVSGGVAYYVSNSSARQIYFNNNTLVQNNSSLDNIDIYIKNSTLNIINAQMLTSKIYLENTILSVHAGKNFNFNNSYQSTFKGEIYLNNTSIINVIGKMFLTNGQVQLSFEQPKSDLICMTATNFNFNLSDLLNLFTTGTLSITNNSKNVVLNLQKVTLNKIVDGQTISEQYDINTVYTLQSQCDIEGKYVESWQVNGQVKNFGEQIVLEEDMTITAVLQNMFKVTFYHKNNVIDEMYVIPNQTINLPKLTLNDAYLLGWTDGENNFDIYSSILVNKDLKFYSVANLQLYVTFMVDGNEISSKKVDFNEFVKFPEFEIPQGKQVSHFLVNGKLSDVKDLNIKSDTIINVVLQDIPPQNTNIILIVSIVAGALILILGAITLVIVKNKKLQKNIK